MKKLPCLLVTAALAGSCAGCTDEPPTNYQAVQAELRNEQAQRTQNRLECFDCDPPLTDGNGHVLLEE